MKDKREIREAIAACDDVLNNIDRALAELSSASNWSLLDMFGGEFFSSFMKRSKISKANRKISDLKLSLNRLRKELSDVDIDLPLEISNSLADNFWDVYFDNIFTDLRVRSELKAKTKELRDLRDKITYIKGRLKREI